MDKRQSTRDRRYAELKEEEGVYRGQARMTDRERRVLATQIRRLSCAVEGGHLVGRV